MYKQKYNRITLDNISNILNVYVYPLLYKFIIYLIVLLGALLSMYSFSNIVQNNIIKNPKIFWFGVTILTLPSLLDFIITFINIKSNAMYNNNILYMEIYICKCELFNYIKTHFITSEWNENTRYVINIMMQHVISLNNPKSKESFKYWCQKVSNDLSKYSLNQKTYEDMYMDNKLKTIPETELHKIFAEISSILENFPGFEKYQNVSVLQE